MTFWLFIYFIGAGILGGLLASIAGLASLVSYPALLIAGIPPVIANVTNTAGLVLSGIGATASSSRELRGEGKLVTGLTALTLAGGILGSALLLIEPASTFEHIVPFFILSAGILLLVSGRQADRRNVPALRDQNKFGLGLKAIGLFLIGAYTGYFGAAGGVIILAILTLSLPQRFAVLNAFKNVMAFMANAVATIIYAWTGKIDWLVVLPLGIGFLIGGYCGPIVVRHVPVRLLRILIAFAAFGLAADLFVQAYF
ncbi:sulfite exporter TauE/SafE family protein [Lacticaseibacillus parahuelsenbergensis]|uniref:Probable membrane transporter protein n=1 Tax=Lacticaseibacillus parahuelsenbergensis TaxID=3068305 RepID=A0ABY9L4H2_9LACO|nr:MULTISPECIES: sulfite exporter TauE/SafE family protein [Lacticaseibacillus]MDE3281699.1 sulfite exporter TauE/SafE family protein [Lacticaseibacillus casei]WLV78634.1 sulfite exporter TauE/SafE family protein [Lacticaseibacillus sp. NCIMB 15471]